MESTGATPVEEPVAVALPLPEPIRDNTRTRRRGRIWMYRIQKICKEIPFGAWLKLIVVFLVCLVARLYLLIPLSETKVRIEVRVSSIECIVNNMPVERERFNFSLSSYDTLPLYIDNATVTAGPIDTKPYEPFIAYSALRMSPIKMEKMFFPTGSIIKLEQNTTQSLSLYLVKPIAVPAELGYSWDIIFQKGLLFNSLTHQYDTIGKDAKDAGMQVFSFEQKLNAVERNLVTFHKPGVWKWPSSLYIKEVHFDDNNSTKSNPISSVLSGKINILETNDSAIYLQERNVLKLTFKKPVEIFLKGDSSGIYANFEGVVTTIEAGPKVMAAENNLMPLRIKALSDKESYWGMLFTAVLAIFTITTLKLKRDS